MAADPLGAGPVASAVPPTAPGELALPPGELALPQRRSVWPVVIGIIALVVGALGLWSNAWQAVLPFLMSPMFESSGNMPNQQGPNPGEMFAAMAKYKYWQLATSGLASVLSLWLLVTGIVLLTRHRAAWGLGISWAVLKIPAVAAGVCLGYLAQQAQFQALPAGTNTPAPAFLGGMMTGMAAAFGCFGLVCGWALPVFVLIWFSLPTVRADVAGWGHDQEPSAETWD